MTEPIAPLDLETVKTHLRVEADADDILITSYMAAAQDYAETFLGRKLDDFDEVPATVAAGLLLHVGLLYEDREGGFTEKNLQAVRLMYWPHRAVSV